MAPCKAVFLAMCAVTSFATSPKLSLKPYDFSAFPTATRCPSGLDAQLYEARWCFCPPSQPFCRGSYCQFTWGQPTVKSRLGYKLHHHARFNLTDARVEDLVLFDGFSPSSCVDCICHSGLPEPTLPAAVRRYQVLHSHVRARLRPARVLQFVPQGVGGLGDRLRGLLTTFWFAFIHDMAFFVSGITSLPMDSHWLPHGIDWHPFYRKVVQLFKNIKLDASAGCRNTLDEWKKAINLNLSAPSMQRFETSNRPLACMIEGVQDRQAVFEQEMEIRQRDHHQPMVAMERSYPEPDPDTVRLAKERGVNGLPHPWQTAFQLLFQPSDELLSMRAQLLTIANMTEDEPYIGIHLRTGISVGEGNVHKRLGGLNAFPDHFACVQALEESLRLPQTTRWYIASDYVNASTELRSWLANNSSTGGANKVLSMFDHAEAELAHIKHASHDKGIMFVMLDFMMLQKSTALVGGQSGFSHLAMLTAGHDRRVLLPSCTVFGLGLP
eukprot:TRINITY_DN11009_c0_g2_i1.p1 TRINITY_DN11009_c0_g2~~TRINITY_DN11009_c0_g2_i1.p1  ORF type:complete len:496 (+),score=72.40 TRINITY_DN11009_c0_g2_i1:98-1585(+)